MNINTIIQVAIGVIFVWVFLAVITSQIQEWVASIFQWRGYMLEESIARMLSDPQLKDKLYNHPLIQGLHSKKGLSSSDKTRRPSGIPSDKFALVLIEQVMNSGLDIGEVKDSFEKLKKNVEAIKASSTESHLTKFAESLDTLLIGIEEKADDATHAITEARKRVESWFDNTMDRLGGAYKRRIQVAGIIIGIATAAILNVDTTAIVNTLWKDPVIREAIVAQANNLTAADITTGTETISTEALAKLPVPIGWTDQNIPADAGGWGTKILGILISGVAAAQGAPYWFDLMRKLLSRK